MTGSPVRDADVSVLTLPREELPQGPLKRPPWTRWLGLGIITAACLAGFYWVRPMGADVWEVETAPVRIIGSSTPPALLSASGYVVAQRQASVASKGTGRLEYLGVSVGSRVKTGAIIARVQQDDVHAVQQQVQARLDVAKATLTNAQAELRDAQQNYGRAKTLLPNQFVSQAEFDTAANRLRRAEATVRSATAAIAAAVADVQTAEVMLENTLIRAPFDGTVLKKFAEIGEVVAPMASSASSRGAVVLITDMTSLAVEADISESSIVHISPKQPADVMLDAVPGKRYAAEVEQIVPSADRSKGTVPVKIRFLEIDESVLPEMSAKISFHAAPSLQPAPAPRFIVPSSAFILKNGMPVVYVLADDTIREVSVERVTSQSGENEIRGGLTASDRVILAPPASLAPGTRVRVRSIP